MESYYIIIGDGVKKGAPKYKTEIETVSYAQDLAVEEPETFFLICKVIKTVKAIIQKPQVNVNSLKD